MKDMMLLNIFLAAGVYAQTISSIAPVTENNPESAGYQALFHNDTFKPIQGYVAGVSNSNGTGVNFNINLFSFPDASIGPFAYHIHQHPVPSNGNCTATGAHLDPYFHGESPACNPNDPADCQVGDLSGKHGVINNTAVETSFQRSYLDLYLSTIPDTPSFFGNRSVVIHAKNGTRLNCANFKKMEPESGSGNGTSSANSSTTTAGAATATEATTMTESGTGTNPSTTGNASASGIGGGTNAGPVAFTVWSIASARSFAVAAIAFLVL